MDEYFDIVDVKKEFLKNVGPQYQSTYAPQQLDIALYMLNDFCNNVSANGLVLMRQTPVQPTPEYYPEPVPAYEPRFDVRQPYPQPMQPTYPTPQRPPYAQPNYPPQDPFEEYQPPQQFIQPQRPQMRVQQQVNELNQGLQQPRFVPRQPLPQQPQPMQDADLNPDKAKTFVDKIKEMRTPKKSDKINPESD
jgi:hypothetical protein